MNSIQIKMLGLVLILSLGCLSQEDTENYFIQARAYDLGGQDSLALQFYEKAYKSDSNSIFLKKEILTRYIRKRLYDKVLDVVRTSTDRIQLWDLNCYRDGDAVAKFYLYYSDTAQAFNLWQELIVNAVANKHLDSALILSESFVKNLPLYPLPRRIQSKLLAAYKKTLNPLPVLPKEDRN